MKMKEKLIAFFVFIGCIFLLLGGLYVIATDLDFFITQKEAMGKFKTRAIYNKKIELEIEFSDEYREKAIKLNKKFNLNYRDNLQKLDSSHTKILYTKWFNQVYISEIKRPRIMILIIELVLLSIALIGVYSSFFHWFPKGKE